MAPLVEAPNVEAVDLERHLDEYIRALSGRTAADVPQVTVDLAAFDLVYFRWNDDPARREVIEDWLASHR